MVTLKNPTTTSLQANGGNSKVSKSGGPRNSSAFGRLFRAITQGCQLTSAGSACDCRLVLDPPPQQPDPWIYDTGFGQAEQFSNWQSNPGANAPPTFWIPDSAWQLANPGWIAPIPFWLPQLGINLYSTFDPNVLPSGPSSVIQVSIGNNSSASAINTSVQLGMSYLGIGRQKTPVASQNVSIGPNSQVSIAFPTPAAFLTDPNGVPQQWLGAYIDLQNPHDANLANNSAISMWLAISTDGPVEPMFPIVNEFSPNMELISLIVIPLVAGVTTLVNGLPFNGPLGPYAVAPGQSTGPKFQLTVPANVDGGTFLAPLATVVGITASGVFCGGLTVVAAVDD